MRWAVFPKKWKEGRLVLLPKSKENIAQHETSSYRPLTMLSALGKSLERVCLERVRYLVEDKLSKHQYGFRRGRSCEDCVLESVKRIARLQGIM